MSEQINQGRCLCEKISYEIRGPLGPIFHCHCSKCRRWHGAAYRTRASITRAQFKWLSGEEYLSEYWSSEDVRKTFCSCCGSPLISTYISKPDIIGLPLGGLENELGAEPEAHIFTASKASWHQILDELPQYPEWPGSELAVRATHDENN